MASRECLVELLYYTIWLGKPDMAVPKTDRSGCCGLSRAEHLTYLYQCHSTER